MATEICSTICQVMDCRLGSVSRISPNLGTKSYGLAGVRVRRAHLPLVSYCRSQM